MPNIKKRFLITGCVLLAVTAMLILYVILIGTGVITGREQRLVIRAGTAEKLYDGEELICEEWELTYGQLKEGHTIVPVFSGSRSLPGQSPNRVTVRILDAAGVDVTDEYSIEYVEGVLSVYSQKLTIEATDGWKQYDGTPLTPDQNGWILTGGATMMSHRLRVTLSGSITDVGTCPVTITAKVLDQNGQDITQYYEIECVQGTLTVEAREIQLTSYDMSKVYDGLPIEQGSVDVSGEVASGHRLTVTLPQSFSDVGRTQNSFSVEIVDGKGNNVMRNYRIVTQMGTLEILPRELVIESATAKKVYDGAALMAPSYQILQGSEVDGHNLVVDVTGIQTELGSSRNLFTVEIYDGSGQNVMHNYTVYTVPGTLSVVETMKNEPIPDPTPEGPITFFTDYEGLLYLREVSFGDLSGGEWLEGTAYQEEGLFENPLFLLAKTLESSGYISHQVYVTDYNEWCVLPAYACNVAGLDLNSDDVALYRFAEEYTALFIPYDYLSDGYCGLSYEYIGLERAYGQYVHEHYLTVPEEHWDVLQSFIYSNNLYGDQSPDGLRMVLDALRNTFGVNDQPGMYPEDVSPVDILMNWGGEGNDYHFASVATLLYRMMGVPARLVRGYAIQTEGGNWCTLAYEDTSYWVEVYIDGMGWVMLDPLSYEQGSSETPGGEQADPVPGSGDIMGGGRPDTNAQVLQLYSPVSGQVYLRLQSYGPYVNQTWGLSLPFQAADSLELPLYWVGQSLNGEGVGPTSLNIKWLGGSSGYLVPYYVDGGLGNAMDESFIADPTPEYSISYYNYDVLSTLTGLTSTLARYTEEDEAYMAYRAYVYENFLDIPGADLRDTVFRHLTEAKINSGSDTLILDVAKYVKGVADYNLDFPNPTDGTDPIVFFLDVSKVGVCRHYASAAVMLYRGLGIPARYVTGYLGTTEAYTETFVTADKAHAWVEVFIDGLGWVPVEVTGGGGFGSGTDDMPQELIDLYLKPVDVVVEYDGNPHYATEYKKIGNLLPGHTLTCGFEGSLVEPGKIDSYIVYYSVTDDATGEDVTNRYRMHTSTGIIEVLAQDADDIVRPIVIIKPVDVEAVYNGSPHRAEEWEYFEDSEILSNDYRIECEYAGERTDPGYEKSIISRCRIYEVATNRDVTDQFRLRVLPGVITVLEVELYVAIKPVDVIAEYDGTLHSATAWELMDGSYLLPGHTISCDMAGARMIPGSTESRINNFVIYEVATGADVTHLYDTLCLPGTVTVMPRNIYVKPMDVTGICDGTVYAPSMWEYSVGENHLMVGHEMTCVYEGSRVEPGTSDSMIASVTIRDTRTGEDVTDRYNWISSPGLIMVYARDNVTTLVIKPQDVMELYTGQEYVPTAWEYASGSGVLKDGHELVCTYKGSLIYPIISEDAEQAYAPSEIATYRVVESATGQDVTHQYYILTMPGRIAVKELHFTITPMNIIVPYDGQLHEATEYSYKEVTSLYGRTDWMDDYTLIVKLNGGRINYGKDEITVDSVQILDKDGNDVTRAFVWQNDKGVAWECNKGTLQIYAAKLTFTTDSATKVYDGTPISTDKFVWSDNLLPGHSIEWTMPSITYVGEQDNLPDWRVVNARGEDVTGWYILDRQASNIGKLKIKAVELSVRARDAQAVYSPGTTLTCDHYDIISGNLASGDWLEVTIVGSQSTVGYSENTISSVRVYRQVNGERKDVTANYLITKELGILTLLPPY